MKTTARNGEELSRWGGYHCDREYTREAGDAPVGMVEAASKSEAEAAAHRQGFRGPTGFWAHPLQGGLE